MRMKGFTSIGLWIVGGFSLLIALVFCGASALALIERVEHGRGLLFADVEILGSIALIAAIVGATVFFVARKIAAFEKR